MATISLYASRINQMPELLKTTMNNSVAFQNSLKDLKKKILKIDNSACDVYNEAGIVQASVNTQEVISGSIGKLQNTVDEFITDTVNIDNNAADLINRNKNDFYEKYSYLKPTCEKNFWEKAKGSLSKAWEWCKKHWKIVVTAVLVIAAIAILVFCPAAGLGLLALAAAKGVLLGAVIGGVIGGVFSGLIAWRTGKPIWEAVKEGAIDGAMWGAIFGVVSGFGSLAGQILGKSCTALAKFEPLINCAAKTLNGIDMALTGFDLASFGAIMYDPECGWAKFYDKLSSNKFFSALQFGAGLGGTFAYGMKSGIKFDRDHGLSKCFVAGTLVSTFAGFRAIETIKAGDIVLSADEKTGEISYQKVVETYVRETMKLVRLRVNGEEIITTEGHPFYVRELGFVKASELAAGDLLTDSSGNDIPVEAVHTEITDTPVTVYNFQVEKTHTYFVTESCVLVHNGNYSNNLIEGFEREIKLIFLKTIPDSFFQKNRIMTTLKDNDNSPGPKKIEIYKVKNSSSDHNVYEFMLSSTKVEDADCFYFPYDYKCNTTSHYSIPIERVRNGTLVLTGAMQGCAVQVNKISRFKIAKEKEDYFMNLDISEKDNFFNDLDKNEINAYFKEIKKTKNKFYKDKKEAKIDTKTINQQWDMRNEAWWKATKEAKWEAAKEAKWKKELENKKEDYFKEFNGLSDEELKKKWKDKLNEKEEHLLFTHDTNSNSINEKYIDQLKLEGYDINNISDLSPIYRIAQKDYTVPYSNSIQTDVTNVQMNLPSPRQECHYSFYPFFITKENSMTLKMNPLIEIWEQIEGEPKKLISVDVLKDNAKNASVITDTIPIPIN